MELLLHRQRPSPRDQQVRAREGWVKLSGCLSIKDIEQQRLREQQLARRAKVFSEFTRAALSRG
jgi:hypothetical protein